MSVRLMSAVWDSALPHDEKFVALALADWADDEGRSIRPSQARIAWKVGKTDRAVRDTLTKLIERGVFVKESGEGGGRGVVVHYRLIVSKLPTRAPFGTAPEDTSEFANTEVDDEKPGSLEHETRKPTSDDPSVIHHSDPSTTTTRAREVGSGEAEAAETNTRALAVEDLFHGAWGRRGNATNRKRIRTLLRRGALPDDWPHAIAIANEERRDDVIAYALGIVAGCIERAERGENRYGRGDGGSREGGPRGGGAVRGGSTGAGPRGYGGSRGADRSGGNPPTRRAVRAPDKPRSAGARIGDAPAIEDAPELHAPRSLVAAGA